MNDILSPLFRAPVFKRIDDPWIGLLALGIFIFVASIIAIIVLYFLWRRHQKHTQFHNQSYILSNKPTGKRQLPIQIEDQHPKPYETQKMELFVSQNDDERIHARYPPQDGIQQVHQFYERATKAYF